MTCEQQFELVKKHYALNFAGDHAAARELLTDDFEITIPAFMPFGGTYTGKDAFQKLIPIVMEAIAVARIDHIATTVGDDYAMELVEFTLKGREGPPLPVAEVIRFRDGKICEIRPYYYDPFPMIAQAEQRLKARHLESR
jgi:ketosteroid isomerase-like protein